LGESGLPKFPVALKQARQTGLDIKTLCSKKNTWIDKGGTNWSQEHPLSQINVAIAQV